MYAYYLFCRIDYYCSILFNEKNLFVYVITMYNDYTISVSVPVTVTHFVHETII